MSLRARDALLSKLGDLRHEPTAKRIRANIGDQTAVDSTRALLVWEPRRIVPSYAVPIEDLDGELSAATGESAAADAPVLHPGIPFSAHSTPGEALDVRASGHTRAGAAFRPADPELAGHVVLDFNGFDAWYEEDEQTFGHPRDPFHRIDIRRSSRPVRVEVDGELVAQSTRPTLVFETNLPVRYYLPREDITVGLEATPRRTYCPYKGSASYWSFEAGGRTVENLLWTYDQPLEDAGALTGLVSFYDEMFDVDLDGQRRERPESPFSQVLLEEFGVER